MSANKIKPAGPVRKKNSAAVALGRLGGLKGGRNGGKKIWEGLTPEQRSEKARNAVNARWAKERAAREEALRQRLKLTAKGVELLKLVKEGTPWAGRERAGRHRHLNWAFDKGLVKPGLLPYSWELTDEGRSALNHAASDVSA